jgi:hypothetical protein
MTSGFEALVRAVASFEEVAEVRARGEDGYFLEVNTGGGRRQVVMIQRLREEGGEEVLHMMAEIGLAEPSRYEEMLAYNLQLRYGRVALIDDGGLKSFALVYAGALEELDEGGFARAFGEVAFVSDQIARGLRAQGR